MLSLHSLSGASMRTASVGHTCLRTFTSSAPRTVPLNSFSDLLQTMPKEEQRPRPSRNAPTNLATANARPARQSDSAIKAAQDLAGQIGQHQQKRPTQEQVAAQQEGPEFERQMTRYWQSGDVYSPHDLSGVEMSKWKRQQPKNFQGRPTKDVFDTLKINPLNHYWNFAMMSEFMTDMGRVKHNKETNLRPVNQRKIARAVRRAIGIGLMPSVHQHPEILERRQRPQGSRR